MRLIEAEIKDGELLYAFAKLETIDTAVALDLVDGIVGRTIARKDVQAALKAAAAGGVEAEEEREDTTGELFPAEKSAQEELIEATKALLEFLDNYHVIEGNPGSTEQAGRVRKALANVSHAK